MEQKSRKTQARRNRLLLLSVIIILIATLTPGKGISKFEIHNFDKVVHFSIFLFLSINLCYRYLNQKILTEILIWAIFFGLLTEWAQKYIPGRDMSLFDGLADTLGVISGYYLYQKFNSFFDRLLIRFWA